MIGIEHLGNECIARLFWEVVDQSYRKLVTRFHVQRGSSNLSIIADDLLNEAGGGVIVGGFSDGKRNIELAVLGSVRWLDIWLAVNKKCRRLRMRQEVDDGKGLEQRMHYSPHVGCCAGLVLCGNDKAQGPLFDLHVLMRKQSAGRRPKDPRKMLLEIYIDGQQTDGEQASSSMRDS